MIGRLLQSLQQGIERRIRNLMRLVQNVNFVPVARRPIPGRIAQFAYLVEAAGGRRSGDPIAVRQLSAIARIRAIVVFPIPRCPEKMYPCAIRPCSSAFAKVRVTWSCPITSENRCGRYLRAKT
jgi:hypothetical protein